MMRVTSDKGTGVRRRCVWEEYRGVGDVSVVGCVGSLIVATRGVAGPGEVLLNVRHLSQGVERVIQERAVNDYWTQVDPDLGARLAEGLGLETVQRSTQ